MRRSIATASADSSELGCRIPSPRGVEGCMVTPKGLPKKWLSSGDLDFTTCISTISHGSPAFSELTPATLGLRSRLCPCAMPTASFPLELVQG